MKKTLFLLFSVLLLTRSNSQGQKQNIVIDINANTELANIVQVLADKMYYTYSPYYEKVISSFAPYKNHKAVEMARQIIPNGGHWGIPGMIGLRLSDDNKRKIIIPFAENLFKDPFGTKEKLYEYIDALRDFATVSGFKAFFDNNKPVYDSAINRVKHLLDSTGINIPEYFEQFYNTSKQEKYIAYINLLGPGGGYSPLTGSDEKTKPFIINPSAYSNGAFNFPVKYLTSLLFHEFSHPVINPMVKKNYSLFQKSEVLFRSIQKTMKWADGLDTWEGCVNEHIIRAATARFLAKFFGQPSANGELNAQAESMGFKYVRSIYSAINKYDSAQNKDFESFLPQIAGIFDSAVASFKIFTPPSWNALTGKPYRFYVFVYPTQEKNKADTDSIIAKIDAIRMAGSNFNSFMIPDTQALAMDARHTFVCFGTLDGNLMLKKYKEQLPFSIQDDRIVADTVFTGSDYWLNIAIPNPDNPELALFISTAQKIENIRNGSPMYWNKGFVLGRKQDFINSNVNIKMNAAFKLELVKLK